MADEGRDVSEKRVIGLRQVQKRAKQDSDLLFQNVSESDDLFSSLEVIQGNSENDEVCNNTKVVPEDALPVDNSETHRDVISSDYEIAGPSVVSAPLRLWESDDEQSEVSDSSSDNDDRENLCFVLREWSIEAKANHSQLRLLLQRLKPFHPELPLDPRTLLETPTFVNVRTLRNGTYVHIGLKKGLLSQFKKYGVPENTTKLEIDVNVDGLNLSDSSNVECWPILAKCRNLSVRNRVFTVGVFSGSGKPEPLHDYLQDYITEVQTLQSEGIVLENGQKFDVVIRCYVCDAPARAYLKCIKGHTGYSGCERCVDEGEYIGNRLCFQPTVSTLRTDESFLNQLDEEHHKGVSPLTAIMTMLITMFVLDPMHLLYHGVLKRFLKFLLGWCITNARLSAAEIQVISDILMSLSPYIPQEFSRKPRPLDLVSRWKATELRLFLLYVGIVALRNVREEVYHLFLLLHVASRIIASPEHVKNPTLVDYAENLFANFVKHCADKSVFGASFVVYNIHSSLHLCNDVRIYGTIDDFSAFPFENYLGVIKRMIRSGVHIPQQIARRLAEIDQVNEGIPCSSTSLPFSANGWIESSMEFRSLSFDGFMLTPFSEKDSYFMIRGVIAVCQVKKILRKGNGLVELKADLCEELMDFYSYPTDSSKVGVYKFSKMTRLNVTLDVESVSCKCMVLPLTTNTDKVAIVMLHTTSH